MQGKFNTIQGQFEGYSTKLILNSTNFRENSSKLNKIKGEFNEFQDKFKF